MPHCHKLLHVALATCFGWHSTAVTQILTANYGIKYDIAKSKLAAKLNEYIHRSHDHCLLGHSLHSLVQCFCLEELHIKHATLKMG